MANDPNLPPNTAPDGAHPNAPRGNTDTEATSPHPVDFDRDKPGDQGEPPDGRIVPGPDDGNKHDEADAERRATDPAYGDAELDEDA